MRAFKIKVSNNVVTSFTDYNRALQFIESLFTSESVEYTSNDSSSFEKKVVDFNSTITIEIVEVDNGILR